MFSEILLKIYKVHIKLVAFNLNHTVLTVFIFLYFVIPVISKTELNEEWALDLNWSGGHKKTLNECWSYYMSAGYVNKQLFAYMFTLETYQVMSVFTAYVAAQR